MNRQYKRVGLLDHLGHGNLGDEATLTAVMQNLKSRWPSAEIIGLSLNPFDTRKRHGIESYAIRRDSKTPPAAYNQQPSKPRFKAKLKSRLGHHRLLLMLLRRVNSIAIIMPKSLFQELIFLFQSFRITISLDVLIICGGGQLLDSWGGPWQFPYTIFKWIILAKLSKKPCYFLNVGAGPLNHPFSRFLIKHSLFLADYASFRDEQSKALAEQIGFTRKSQAIADCVYALHYPFLDATDLRPCNEPIVVGLSPMAFCDPRRYWKKDQHVYDCLIQTFACLGSWLLQNGHRLALFSTDVLFDSQAIEDLEAALEIHAHSINSHCVKRRCMTTTEGVLSQISLMDYVVTCRFHGVIFAHLLNKPVLAISHHAKVARIMEDLGLSEYCVKMDDLDSNLLINKFGNLIENAEKIKARMAETSASYRAKLMIQFDELFRV